MEWYILQSAHYFCIKQKISGLSFHQFITIPVKRRATSPYAMIGDQESYFYVVSKLNPISSKMRGIKMPTFYLSKTMKKNLFIAALLCSISFAGKAATNEMKEAAIAKKPTTSVAKPTRVKLLYEMTFDCPKQGWSIPVVGYTRQEMANAYMFYQTHLDC